MRYSATPSSYILTGSADGSIRLYNPAPSNVSPSSSSNSITSSTRAPGFDSIPTGRLIQTYSLGAQPVLSLSVSSTNAHFVSSGVDRTVYLWDVGEAQTIRRFGDDSQGHGHTGRVNAVTFGGAGDSVVISGGHDTTVRIWDAKKGSGKPIQILTEATDAVTSIVVSNDAEIIAGSVDGRVRTYDIRMGKSLTDTFPASVTSLSLSKDGKMALVGTLDSKLRLMDRESGNCLRTYSDPERKNEDLRVQSCLGGKDRFVVAGDEVPANAGGSSSPAGDIGPNDQSEGRIWAWDLESGALVAKIPVPWGPSPPSNAGTNVGGTKRPTASAMMGRDLDETERKNVISCLAWKEDGYGNQFCVGGTSGIVSVFGE